GPVGRAPRRAGRRLLPGRVLRPRPRRCPAPAPPWPPRPAARGRDARVAPRGPAGRAGGGRRRTGLTCARADVDRGSVSVPGSRAAALGVVLIRLGFVVVARGPRTRGPSSPAFVKQVRPAPA